jgi:hypothetical protein
MRKLLPHRHQLMPESVAHVPFDAVDRMPGISSSELENILGVGRT